MRRALVLLLLFPSLAWAQAPAQESCDVRLLTAERDLIEARVALDQLRAAVIGVVTGIGPRLDQGTAAYQTKAKAIEDARKAERPKEPAKP